MKALKAEKAKKSKKDEKSVSNKKATDKVLRNRDKASKGKKKDNDGEEKKKELLEAVPRDYNVIFEFPEPDPLSIPIIQVS